MRPWLGEHSRPAFCFRTLEKKPSSLPILLFSVWERTKSQLGGRGLRTTVKVGIHGTVVKLVNPNPHEEFPDEFPGDTLG